MLFLFLRYLIIIILLKIHVKLENFKYKKLKG